MLTLLLIDDPLPLDLEPQKYGIESIKKAVSVVFETYIEIREKRRLVAFFNNIWDAAGLVIYERGQLANEIVELSHEEEKQIKEFIKSRHKKKINGEVDRVDQTVDIILNMLVMNSAAAAKIHKIWTE